ncbi:methylated-DNA--[protein]-cysteine S-methyltransferase [Algoriphagus hitonicola]|uniref:Methylated-DNA--protein-cysteine methyltransferase n=1 Tax=Algoriphagus hitonicola TaxID=435880 RepID=A0A1I2P7V3_9BACT|nr:methylated-DNA--[protein]-cysteine S-methyltransferase [Algoriphagus hitonicola]SFG10047.1 methylated-DNA-[protein]-cysteine S-methyltransferase [Algoriphagus hitonicola]
MEKIQIHTYKGPIGELVLGSYQERLCLCEWAFRKMRKAVDSRIQNGLKAEFEPGKSEVIEQTIRQLEEYFEQKRKVFDIPLLFVGSEFQRSVWEKLGEIPFGETRTYLGLSKELGNPDAIRAVATANGANAISIIIPCHRVIGSDGSLVGYAGGLDAKKRLLKLENARVISNKDQMGLF